MILLVDNFDSFVANIARYFRRIDLETKVVRNDEVDCQQVAEMNPSAIVISPGPCTPAESGQSTTLIKEFAGKIPILGICLGHQAIGAVYGARIIRAPEPFHGRQSTLTHNHHFLFRDVPEKFDACRYHSLVIENGTLPNQFEVTCQTADGTIMAIASDPLKLFGLQFHPESILTPFGFRILQNFVENLGMQVPSPADVLFATESGKRTSGVTTANEPFSRTSNSVTELNLPQTSKGSV